MFSIVIPSWNNLPYLKLCVESLQRHSSVSHEIIVHINDGSDGSVIENVEVRYAGNVYRHEHGQGYRPAIQISAADISLVDVMVRDSDSTGVRMLSGAPSLTNVVVLRARHDAFYGTVVATPTLTNLTAVDASGDRYALDGGELPGDRTWWMGGLPIEMYGDVTIPANTKLTIAPGQVIKLSNEEQFNVSGTLTAVIIRIPYQHGRSTDRHDTAKSTLPGKDKADTVQCNSS